MSPSPLISVVRSSQKAGDLVILCYVCYITLPLCRAKESENKEKKKKQEFVQPTWHHRSYEGEEGFPLTKL